MRRLGRPLLKALAAVTGNFSAAWFALAFVTPNFTSIFRLEGVLVLTKNVVLGILFLVATAILEKTLLDE